MVSAYVDHVFLSPLFLAAGSGKKSGRFPEALTSPRRSRWAALGPSKDHVGDSLHDGTDGVIHFSPALISSRRRWDSPPPPQSLFQVH